MKRLYWCGILALLAMAVTARGQSFDVATITRSQGATAGREAGGRERVERFPTSLSIRNASLSFCIQWAYGLKFYQISGPAWLADERFDIVAKTQTAVSEGQARVMLESLLAERFKLILHREEKELPVYELVVGQAGHKLRESRDGGVRSVRVSDGSFVFQRTTMAEFAEQLSDFVTVGRLVIDRTGIIGAYDFTLKGGARALLEPDGPSIFTIVQEDTGLKVEPRKRAVEMLVVDHAEKRPVGN